MEEHFKGIVPEERWKNELLSELRMIRELLERMASSDAQTTVQETSNTTKEKRTYRRRGA